MSPDTTPRDEIAAWLASPEVDDLVARVESRLDKPTARLCDDCHERPAGPYATWTRQHGPRWLCIECKQGY